MKNCSVCKKTLSIALFYTDRSKKDGLGSKCKECAKFSSRKPPKNLAQRKKKRKEWEARNKGTILEYQHRYRASHRESTKTYNRNYKRTKAQKHRLSVYGITQEMYDFLKLRQSNSCAICEKIFVGKIAPQIDHDHATGNVRGLLCWNCNIRLGYFENEIFSAQVKKYLQREYIEIKNKES